MPRPAAALAVTDPSTTSTRRSLLATLGTGAVALAGCVGGADFSSDSSGDYPLVRQSMGETHDPDEGPTVTVRNPRLRTAVVIDQHTSPVGMTRGRQFVVVDVAVGGEAANADGRDHEANRVAARFGALLDGEPADGRSAPLRPSFHEAEAGRPVGVPVAVGAVDEAAVAGIRGLPKSVTWSLPADVTDALASAASFRVDGVTATDEPDPQLRFEVRNVGDRGGRFFANVSGSQVQDGNLIVGFDVPAGERVTHTARPGIRAPAGEETRVVVDWGADRAALVVSP
mgnify:FL=1